MHLLSWFEYYEGFLRQSSRTWFGLRGKGKTCIFESWKEYAINIQSWEYKEFFNIFPAHGAITPPSSIHFALEIQQAEYEAAKNCLIQNKIVIEKEVSWGSRGKSMYFRDPVHNLVEIITKGQWPVKD
jgi:hypothetical protein